MTNKINRKKVLMQFTEFIAEDQELNNSWSMEDKEWVDLLIKKSADFINHQIKILHIYNDEELTNSVFNTIDKEISVMNDLLKARYEEREELKDAD